MRPAPVRFSALALTLAGVPLQAAAATVDYSITVETATSYGAGTDNHVNLTVTGVKGSFRLDRIDMDNEAGQRETVKTSREDIGKITSLTIALQGASSADAWTPQTIVIEGNEGTRADFTSLGDVSPGSTRQFSPSSSTAPASARQIGDSEVRTTTVTTCHFADNTGNSGQLTTQKYTERWSELRGVEFSSSKATTLGVAATVSYQSPASSLGSAGVSVTGSWEQTISRMQSEVTQTLSESQYDWSFDVPPFKAKVVCTDFEVPMEYALVSDGSNSFIMRGLARPVVPTTGYVQEIPQTDAAGNTVAVRESTLTAQLAHMTSRERARVEALLPTWRASGWVTGGSHSGGSTDGTTGAARVGRTVRLRSVNHPDAFVRHSGFQGLLTPVSSDLDRQDSSFVVRAGLAGSGVSLESVNYPGYFLRHSSFGLRLDRREDSDLFRKDASFYDRSGLAGKGRSLESVNYPGHYVRHCNSRIYIDNNQRGNGACRPSTFNNDVSFELVSI